jgi:transposase
MDDSIIEAVKENSRGVPAKLSLLQLAQELGNVSKACTLMGYSRDSFYRLKKRFENGGEAALENVSRRAKPLLKNRVAPRIEAAIIELARQHPSWGQGRVAAELAQRGLMVSAAGVRCVWQRHGIQTARLRGERLAEGAPERPRTAELGLPTHWNVSNAGEDRGFDADCGSFMDVEARAQSAAE